ncbi:MAG: RraA family protein [Lachnospiraceae bacterium]|nr:RraA family protein [Lachnospiraceae bacterium]
MILNNREEIIGLTRDWKGERSSDGRPRVADEKIEILKTLTQEEIWHPLYFSGYRFQFQGGMHTLHAGKKLYGRAVTCCFMPQRPDLRRLAFDTAREKGWKGDCNQWVIDSLQEGDVVVCDLYDKIFKGTFVGGNLTTAIQARTKTGGVVVWGGVRDIEQMQKMDVQVYYRGVDPTPIRDCQITAFNGACRIGQALCLPGDIVIGTKNGVIFVPSHMVDMVIKNAYKMQARDMYAFPRLSQGIYTTADVDAPVWGTEMMRDFLHYIETQPEAAKYRGLDWDVELRAARGDRQATEEMLRRFDIEIYTGSDGGGQILI